MKIQKQLTAIKEEIEQLKDDYSVRFLTMAKLIAQLQLKVNSLENAKTPEKPKSSAKPKRKITKS